VKMLLDPHDRPPPVVSNEIPTGISLLVVAAFCQFIVLSVTRRPARKGNQPRINTDAEHEMH